MLRLDYNSIGDAGAQELAAALDRGLVAVSLVSVRSAVSAGLRWRLYRRSGPRIAFILPAAH